MTCRQCEGPEGKFIYTFLNKRVTRPQASQGCMQRNETLAKELSRHDYMRLYSRDCCLSRTRSYWIGLDKSSECNRTKPYRWWGTKKCVDSSPLSITGYRPSGCQSLALPPITSLASRNGFAVPLRNCNEKLGYICQKLNQPAATSSTPENYVSSSFQTPPNTRTHSLPSFNVTSRNIINMASGGVSAVVIGGIFLLVLMLLAIFRCRKYRKAKLKSQNGGNAFSMPMFRKSSTTKSETPMESNYCRFVAKYKAHGAHQLRDCNFNTVNSADKITSIRNLQLT